MTPVLMKITALALSALLALGAPALAQQNDGIDNDGDGQIDEPDEYDGGSPGGGQMEASCVATARPEICLNYFRLYCQQYGFANACAMASLGQNCYGGDPGRCQYFVGLLQANSRCSAGDQSACAWLNQQPALQ